VAAGTDRLVLGVVGTDHHPFDRLVSWVDQWFAASGRRSLACFVQFGRSHPPQQAGGVAFVDHDDLQRLLRTASAVVCHGGPGVITEARKCGLRPLVIPRSPIAGEHVDDHQVRFCQHLAGKGLIELISTQAELSAALDRELDSSARSPGVPIDATTDPAAEAVRRLRTLVDQLLAGDGETAEPLSADRARRRWRRQPTGRATRR
jgi:UDP-N-acetylglucosamine transferase subunit ALG13